MGLPGLEDDEHPGRTPNLQTCLADLGSSGRLSQIRSELAAEEDWPAINQLDDLRAPGTDHTWLWALAGPDGSEVRPREFCTAVRLRVGAALITSGQACACCGSPLDARCLHALRCAPGESTRGHNWVAGSLADAAALSDPSAAVEPHGLIPSRPGLRPADLLTSAASGRLTALDVSIVCPDSAGATDDPCVAAASRKVDKYRDVLEEMRDEGIGYRPLVWSCWGRPSSDAAQAVRSIAAAASRRRGLGDPAQLERHLCGVIGAQIWRRAACMVLACLPETPAVDVQRLVRIRGDRAWGGPPGTAPCLQEWLVSDVAGPLHSPSLRGAAAAAPAAGAAAAHAQKSS